MITNFKIFENKDFENYLGKFCIIYFGVNIFIVHVKNIMISADSIEFSYYSYDEKISEVKYRDSTTISLDSFKPTGVCDTFEDAEKEYLLLLNAKKYNI